ncbi:MAG: winged helix-turn-helix transcriptional regulator [Cellulosilyticum sp.]|nr:winged helix-turn-helix transcriptional regulator [Cellulosilyticum sp.]
MSEEKDYVAIFKALADETRLEIVKMLAQQAQCPCHILQAFDISQPTLSYHIKVLCEAGIIEGKRQGAVMECRVNPEKIRALKLLFKNIEQTLENNINTSITKGND